MTQNNLGNAWSDQAKDSGGQERKWSRSTAVDAYRAALDILTLKSLPQQWARIQNNLGVVLSDQAKACSGENRRRLLGRAVEAYQSSLKIRSSESLPQQQWARTQNNLGVALRLQAGASSEENPKWRLEQAIQAFRCALSIYKPKSRQWAITKYNLGIALTKLHRYPEAKAVYQKLRQECEKSGTEPDKRGGDSQTPSLS